MAATIQSSGDIEIICHSADISAGSTAQLVFRTWDDASPPFTLKVKSPDGKTILERVLRELPTGKFQSAPPIAFSAESAGDYRIEIKELYGSKLGEATLSVT